MDGTSTYIRKKSLIIYKSTPDRPTTCQLAIHHVKSPELPPPRKRPGRSCCGAVDASLRENRCESRCEANSIGYHCIDLVYTSLRWRRTQNIGFMADRVRIMSLCRSSKDVQARFPGCHATQRDPRRPANTGYRVAWRVCNALEPPLLLAHHYLYSITKNSRVNGREYF